MTLEVAPEARRQFSVAATRRVTYLIVSCGLLGALVAASTWGPPWTRETTDAMRVVRRPAWESSLDAAPAEVQEFLARVMDRIPGDPANVAGYRLEHWESNGRPTREAVGLKAVPGVDPERLIARVMEVDGYRKNIPYVEACRSRPDPEFPPPEKVRFFQSIRVPGVARIQQELVLVDAGTIKGYRVAYWYLLKDETLALDPALGARSDYNVGAWLAAPGVVGYALSSCPRRRDVNSLQWVSLTSGANALARKVIEGNIDGMAAWAKKPRQGGPPSD